MAGETDAKTTETVDVLTIRAYKTDTDYFVTSALNHDRLRPGNAMFAYAPGIGWRANQELLKAGTLIQERPLNFTNKPQSDEWPQLTVQGAKTAPFDQFADIVDSYNAQKKGCLSSLWPFGKKQPALAEFVYKELERLNKV